METMDELLDNIITDDSPSQISDTIKDMLYAKTAERVNSYKQTAADAIFNNGLDAEEVSDTELEASDGV
tara:strand:- start:993 stop:1199 length:207 start_codon:yes stop_codon:yes gene_type:complete